MKKYLIRTVVVGLTLSISPWLAAQEAGQSRDDWVPLYEFVDASLQKSLETALNADRRFAQLVKRKKMAVAVVDMSGDTPRFARVNGNRMMYAASLPKIAILLGAYASLDDGTIEDTPELRIDLGRMIRFSDNASATRVIDLVGMDKINRVLTDKRYGLYDETRGGGLWVGKRYAKQGQRRGDPLNGISHGATATQVARFYYLLAEGRLISPGRSAQMLADLADPRLNHKFVRSARRLAPKARLYRKSGTWRQWHSDSILVRGEQWRNYILVAIVESEHGNQVIADLLPLVELLLEPQAAATYPVAGDWTPR